jgi:hypothetical protein
MGRQYVGGFFLSKISQNLDITSENSFNAALYNTNLIPAQVEQQIIYHIIQCKPVPNVNSGTVLETFGHDYR